MTQGQPGGRRRGVTRGYVGGLTGAVTIAALTMVVAGWGGIAWLTGRAPVETPGIAPIAAELIVFVALVLLAVGLWRQAVTLLRGRSAPPWAHTIVLALGAYFIWCLGGVLIGLSIAETWISPFAIALAVAWGLCSVLFWAVLARRVYTDRPRPRWPWERRGEQGPDWASGWSGYSEGGGRPSDGSSWDGSTGDGPAGDGSAGEGSAGDGFSGDGSFGDDSVGEGPDLGDDK